LFFFQAEQEAAQSSKTLKKIIIALAVLLVLNVAATAGLTYAIVALTKDTNVDNNVLVSKDSGDTLGSATVIHSEDLENLYQITDPVELAGLEHLIIPADNGKGYDMYVVGKMNLVPGERLTLNLTLPVGASIVIDSSGLQEYISGTDSNKGVGRRLLQDVNALGVMTSQVFKSRFVKATLKPTPTTQAPTVQRPIPNRNSKAPSKANTDPSSATGPSSDPGVPPTKRR
jgi:hypothetical protein